jgi:DNA-directed RNA polymerase specialized sigma24 family protein
MNTASTLITKASKQYRAMPIVDMPDNFENKLQDLNPQTSTLEIVDMLKSLDLSYIEKAFIRLRMQGYSMKELGENLDIKGVYRLNKQIKQKVREQLGKEREANN